MKTVIFAGPTLWDDPVMHSREFQWLPPASEGDVYRVARGKPPAIGLVDGRFETVPSVWHKELLWALAQGVHVFGAASMGALRAAELHRFGMIGVGSVFESYRKGLLDDDDEVAVLHAPAELNYRPLSEALVDIRATIEAATLAKVISRRAADELVRMARRMFFKDRNWDALLTIAAGYGLPNKQIKALDRWVLNNRVQRKRLDALEMIEAMRRFLRRKPRPFGPKFTFRHTVYWQNLVDTHEP
jgi:hypothetical protein